MFRKRCSFTKSKGFLYTEENIDRMLEQRHISQKIRRAGGRTSNPKKEQEKMIYD